MAAALLSAFSSDENSEELDSGSSFCDTPKKREHYNTDFRAIFDKEVALRHLVRKDVERCHKNLYHELSKHAHGNDGSVVIRKADFTLNEHAALISLMKFQDTWKFEGVPPLKWREK